MGIEEQIGHLPIITIEESRQEGGITLGHRSPYNGRVTPPVVERAVIQRKEGDSLFERTAYVLGRDEAATTLHFAEGRRIDEEEGTHPTGRIHSLPIALISSYKTEDTYITE